MDLDSIVESQLNLQVKISYPDHHDFLVRYGLNECGSVLDIGTGNGAFVARLAQDHPGIKFVGVDKRKHCVESCKKFVRENLEFGQVDLFSRNGPLDFSKFDGFLMRYFLLHVDHSKKILESFKGAAKKGARFWVIDLDFSRMTCDPPRETFNRLASLVKDFCTKISVDSFAGQRVMELLQELNYQNIVCEHHPFSSENVPLDDLALYLKQEIQCYSRMSGRAVSDPETAEVVRFIDEDIRMGKVQISYGMILVSAELD